MFTTFHGELQGPGKACALELRRREKLAKLAQRSEGSEVGITALDLLKGLLKYIGMVVYLPL